MLEQSIREWIEKFLNTPSKTLNNLPPCPFAKQALITDKIVIQQLKPLNHISMKDYFKAEIENYTYNWPKDKEVVVLGCEPTLISATELEACVDETYKLLEDRGYVALEDHPHHVESVKDLVFNQGDYALILIQEADKLDKARKILAKQDYYKNWPQEYYEDVVDR